MNLEDYDKAIAELDEKYRNTRNSFERYNLSEERKRLVAAKRKEFYRLRSASPQHLAQVRHWRANKRREIGELPVNSMILLKPNAKAKLTYKDGFVPKSRLGQIWFVDADLGNGWVNINTTHPRPGAYCSNVHKKDIFQIIRRGRKK